MRHGLSGTIRFGCPDDYAEVWLPALLRQFSSQHPQAIVEVVCGPTPRLIEQLDKRAVDLAMISLPDDGANGDIIRREQLVWIGYPAESAHFDPLPLALSDRDTLDHLAACEALDRAGRDYRVAYASSSLAGLIALVRSGQAFAVMTQTAVPADRDRHRRSSSAAVAGRGYYAEVRSQAAVASTAAFAEHIRLTLPLL